MTRADDTLALGQELFRQAGGTLDRDAAYRKAIHCAYYAAFTAVCEEWAATFERSAQPSASRMLAHRTVREACKAPAGGMFKGGGACPAEITECATLLPQLQDAREQADYDPTAVFGRTEVALALGQAGKVIRSLRNARTHCRAELHLFLLACAGSKR